MKKKMKLSTKLVSTYLAVCLVPLILMGLLSLRSLASLNQEVTAVTSERLTEDAEANLTTGARRDRDEITGFVRKVEADAIKIAGSGTLKSFIETSSGESAQYDQFTRTLCNRILKGYAETASIQNASTRRTLETSLALAENIMLDIGRFATSDTLTEWDAVNQFSHERQTVQLPTVQLGETLVPRNADANHATPFVDDIVTQTGSHATLFQRMNEAGDMLRIATSVIGKNGKRAIGTFIPAVNPDGRPNRVIETLMKGETYIGRAFVVNEWYITAYRPIRNADGRIEGVLFVGLKENELNTALHQALVSTKIGKTGYPFVMDNEGNLLIHPRAELVGKNVITDLKVPQFRDIVDSRKAGEYGWATYEFDGRTKFTAYTYFPEWQWIICASGYRDEMSGHGLEVAKNLLQQDLLQLCQLTKVTTPRGEHPAYPRVALLDPLGEEIVAIENGRLLDDSALQSQKDDPWFQHASQLPEHTSFISPVMLTDEGNESRIRVLVPVHLQNTLRCVVAVDADWQLARDLLSDSVYGKTGYAYIINEQGVLITHPKYTLADHTDLTNAKYGALATLVKDRMLKGEEAIAEYEFEGTKVYTSFTPLKMGANNYAIATRAPIDEVMAIERDIQALAADVNKTQMGTIGVTTLVLGAIGALTGLLISISIGRPLTRIMRGLTEGAHHVSEAAGHISNASQQLAQGTSEQASSLEEASSALEQMTAMTHTSAENAKKVADLSRQARSAAESGDKTMQDFNAAMAGINESSEKISKIIHVIEEIAFQTNLLALNAAVEAARAGEHGKGFAVVAGEVGNLAQRAADAAGETTSLIEDSVARSQSGTSSAAQVGHTLADIVQDVTKISDLIGGIASASSEQAQGVDQVNTAVSEIDKVTQHNASGAEESAAAAEELSSQAQALKGVVDQLGEMISGTTASETPLPRKTPQRAFVRKHAPRQRMQAPTTNAPASMTDSLAIEEANSTLQEF